MCQNAKKKRNHRDVSKFSTFREHRNDCEKELQSQKPLNLKQIEEINEKLLIENVRLRKEISILGSELN